MEVAVNVTVSLFYLFFPHLMIYSPMVDVEIQFEASSACNKISPLFLSRSTVKCVLDSEGVQGKVLCSHNNIELFYRILHAGQDHNNSVYSNSEYSMKLQMDWWICQFSLFLLSLQGDTSLMLKFNRCQLTLGRTKCFFWHINAV